MKILNKNNFIVMLFLVCVVEVFAQKENKSIYFNDEISIDSINILLTKQCFPFKLYFSSESLRKGVDELVIHYGINKKNEIYKTYSDIGAIICIIQQEKEFYLILFYDQVGYDFFLIVQKSPFEIFKSEYYNYEQDEGYNFINESLNLENNTIKIFLSESRIEKTINFNNVIIKSN